jgi:hypothetical protein
MRLRLPFALVFAALLSSAPVSAANRSPFSFGVIFPGTPLQEAIDESNADNLAFMVTIGLKPADEPCSDKVYEERKQMLDGAQHGIIVSLTASDWAECRDEDGKSAATGRLSRLRDLLFSDEFSAGGTRIPVIRQSTILKFRSYAENMRWQIGGVMFATINLPANNNDYVRAAGRNSEFEDRLIANRDWLHRLFILAEQKKVSAIVLFCDGNPMAVSSGGSSSRDGFAEIRRQISNIAARFPGRILIVHGQGGSSRPPGIHWHGKLGEATGAGLARVVVAPNRAELFSIAAEPSLAANRHR